MNAGRARGLGTTGLLCALLGCSDGLTWSERLQQPIVYDTDGRAEYHEATDPRAQARIARSSVAFIPRRYLDAAGARLVPDAPAWGELEAICPEESFVDQPAVAFCSGVLVDWDLVLTAGHCVRLYALGEFSLVFGYYYAAPDELALDAGGSVEAVEILAEAFDPEGPTPRLDYAWLRLARPVSRRFEPVPIHSVAPPLASGDSVLTIGAPSGVPLKLDASGTVEDARGHDDFFVARTDTSRGWSGGGAYDDGYALVGILARGGDDLTDGPDGCRAVVRVPASAPAAEEFTYAHRALERLCEKEPLRSICRSDCAPSCQAAPSSSSVAAVPPAGCGIAPFGRALDGTLPLLLLALLPPLGRAARRRSSTLRASSYRSDTRSRRAG